MILTEITKVMMMMSMVAAISPLQLLPKMGEWKYGLCDCINPCTLMCKSYF